jgi:LssY C-terminus
MRLVAAFFSFCLAAFSQTIEVPATQVWTDTGIDVRPGDHLSISAEGTLQLPQAKLCGPEGAARGFRDLLKSFPANEAGLGALIGRVGATDVAVPFLIGAEKDIQTHRPGRLFLGVNRTNESLTGTYRVKVLFLLRGPETPPAPTNLRLPAVTLDMIDRIARRVTDEDGNPGDNTNFVIAGTERKVIETFKAAGWVTVDRGSKNAVESALTATLNKQAYVELPMSILTLFGRPQDYGLAHAEPVTVVAKRHHLRMWKAPFTVEGGELWVGAATHDVGFDRDNRPGKKLTQQLTHKIDPDIDLEREYVARSLEETGLVAKTGYIMPTNPVKQAATATGATFHSDGRLLVIYLLPPSTGR